MRFFSISFFVETGERGVAMLEFAIVSLGIIFGLLLTFDVGLAISQYMLLSQAGYEGLQLASVLPDLEDTTISGPEVNISATAAEIVACVDKLPSTIACQHFLVQQRIRSALQQINAFDSIGIKVGIPDITTEYTPSTAGTGVEDDTVSVQLEVDYNGFFLPALPLVIDIQAAYLYEDI